MWLDVDKLKEGCPKELEDDMKEIEELSRKFLKRVKIWADEELEEIKLNVQEGKDYLFQIFARFLTLITEYYTPNKEDTLEIGYKLKFEEDMGSVISDLKDKHSGKYEKLIGFSSVLRYAGDLKMAYDFIVYHPIIYSNRSNEENLNDYFKDIFKVVRNNASILGYVGKPIAIKPSQRILPKPEALIAQIKKSGEEEQPQEEEQVTEGYLDEEEEEHEDLESD